MNGAESLVRSLLNCGVNTCFANPGTSEMHFVAALDRVPGMRCVPSLFEGVATGAADGYGRMLDKPAATLLHLGPGLANGLANLHNARRAGTPVVNIVGEHASWHLTADAPLHTDIAALAGPMSRWVHTSAGSLQLGQDAVDAVHASMAKGGQVATLIAPADAAWQPGAVGGKLEPPTCARPRPRPSVLPRGRCSPPAAACSWWVDVRFVRPPWRSPHAFPRSRGPGWPVRLPTPASNAEAAVQRWSGCPIRCRAQWHSCKASSG
ncbi:thiamine pyrophosphate-binding protein [Achromobacter sp. DMS1]|uniref:thiamine pyrophosphate-binding protein n=1 Tax=Achromobacter sp. DMS1 TaxID=1688405 RepID=UPI000AEFD0FE